MLSPGPWFPNQPPGTVHWESGLGRRRTRTNATGRENILSNRTDEGWTRNQVHDALQPEEILRTRFEEAPTYGEYFSETRKLRELWEARETRSRLPADIRDQVEALGEPRYLLAITYDGCGDGVDLLPWIARMAEGSPKLELRILERGDHLDIMDRYLTDGRSRSVPVVIVLDEEFREIGWWGPRPRELQAWVTGPGMELDPKDRYREVRRWYARDRGRTTMEEVLELLGKSAGEPAVAGQGSGGPEAGSA